MLRRMGRRDRAGGTQVTAFRPMRPFPFSVCRGRGAGSTQGKATSGKRWGGARRKGRVGGTRQGKCRWKCRGEQSVGARGAERDKAWRAGWGGFDRVRHRQSTGSGLPERAEAVMPRYTVCFRGRRLFPARMAGKGNVHPKPAPGAAESRSFRREKADIGRRGEGRPTERPVPGAEGRRAEKARAERTVRVSASGRKPA